MDCWIENYKPSFENLLISNEKINKLKKFVRHRNIPLNININGIKGSGKLMLVKCIIHNYLKVDFSDFCNDREYSFLKYYNNVFFFNLMNVNSDIKEFVNLLNKFARFRSIDSNYKVIIIPNVDKLQDKYLKVIATNSEKSNLRFITTTSSIIKIPQKYIASCYKFNISHLNNEEFKLFYKRFKKQYNITSLNTATAYSIYKNSNYNLKNTLLKIQIKINKLSDINFFDKIVINLLNLCYTTKFEKIKDYIYTINSLNIDSNDLLKKILTYICKNSSILNKDSIISLCADTSHNLSICNQSIIIMENFFFNLSILLQK